VDCVIEHQSRVQLHTPARTVVINISEKGKDADQELENSIVVLFFLRSLRKRLRLGLCLERHARADVIITWVKVQV